jgi:hypothetical protein
LSSSSLLSARCPFSKPTDIGGKVFSSPFSILPTSGSEQFGKTSDVVATPFSGESTLSGLVLNAPIVNLTIETTNYLCCINRIEPRMNSYLHLHAKTRKREQPRGLAVENDLAR